MRVELFSRPGCHLCDEAMKVLEEARLRHSFELVVLDVDDDPAWQAAYGLDVPVVVIDGRKAFKHRIAPDRLRRYLERT